MRVLPGLAAFNGSASVWKEIALPRPVADWICRAVSCPGGAVAQPRASMMIKNCNVSFIVKFFFHGHDKTLVCHAKGMEPVLVPLKDSRRTAGYGGAGKKLPAAGKVGRRAARIWADLGWIQGRNA